MHTEQVVATVFGSCCLLLVDRRWQTLGDPDFGRAILTQEVRDAIDEVEEMVEPLRSVPAHVWGRYGGAPRFLRGG